MTLGLALAIVLGFLVVALGFVTYHLATRLGSLEAAVSGGLETPDHALTSLEYASRFSAAVARSELAADLGDGISLFVDSDSASNAGLLDVVANLATGRGITLVCAGDPPQSRWPDDLTVRSGFGAQFEAAGIVATPYGMVIADQRVVAVRILGSTTAIYELLGVPAPSQAPIEPTPLEVD
jgi:hypothetical protein